MRWAGAALLVGTLPTACLALSPSEDLSSTGGHGGADASVAGSGGWPSGGGGATGGGGADAGGTSGADATAGADSGGASSMGVSCVSDSNCPGGLCAPLGALVGTGTGSVCTKTCCSSDECPADSICYPTPRGFTACLPPALVKRGAPGTLASGSSCSAGSDCRSALCVSGKCRDACCSDSDCPGAKCSFSELPGTQYLAFQCASPPGAAGAFAACTSTNDCTSGLCSGKQYCVPPCCSNADCGGQAKVCGYATLAALGDVARVCAESTPGAKPNGAVCSTGSECAGGYCLPATKTCSAACCTDADCGDSKLGCRAVAYGLAGVALLCAPIGP